MQALIADGTTVIPHSDGFEIAIGNIDRLSRTANHPPFDGTTETSYSDLEQQGCKTSTRSSQCSLEQNQLGRVGLGALRYSFGFEKKDTLGPDSVNTFSVTMTNEAYERKSLALSHAHA